MGLKGLTLYHLKSHLQVFCDILIHVPSHYNASNFACLLFQKYRLGQLQAKKQHTTDNSENSYGHHNMHIASRSTNSSSINTEQGEIPIAEALRCQIEVQKTLQQQIEVQKKLQMRIESQGKYLQAILEKAQHSLSTATNQPESLESTKAQLTDFNLALSTFMQTINGGGGDDKNGNVTDYDGKAHETKDMIKLKIEGPSAEFDLNSRSSYDFFGINGSLFETKPHHNR
ncbi:hypothetical protein ACS0TY_011776 [Phlomoides rotata]